MESFSRELEADFKTLVSVEILRLREVYNKI